MSSVQIPEEVHNSQLDWFQLLGRLGIVVATYPFECVKTLIQIGHEPLPPRPTHTLFGRPAMALPGVFTYMKHIKSIDGFFGVYRGIIPKICTNFISMSTHIIAYERLPNFGYLVDKPKTELSDEQKLILHCQELAKTTVARCISITFSHPFYIITIRSIAQFVGREERYSGIFGSLWEIYQQDGILGFFSGLIPRIFGEMLIMWAGSISAVLINTYLIDEETLKGYVRASTAYLSSALFYPFFVVSHCSIVNNCGLAAGLPSNMPVYSSWTDCWSHLSAIGQLKRGSSIIFRYYNGPFIGSAIKKNSRHVFAKAFPSSILKYD